MKPEQQIKAVKVELFWIPNIWNSAIQVQTLNWDLKSRVS